MTWTSLQPHKKAGFVNAATTMTVPLEADGEGGFCAGGSDGVGSGGGATVRPPSLREHMDATTTAPLMATRSHRHYVNLMSLLGAVLSDPKTDAEEMGAAIEIISVVAMHDPGLVRKYSLDYNTAVATAGTLPSSSPEASHPSLNQLP